MIFVHALQIGKKKLKNTLRTYSKLLLGRGRMTYNGSINFVDIGASGILPSPWFENTGHIKNLLAFEPNDKRSKREHHIKVDKALWSEREKRPFYVYRHLDGSSLFEQNYEYVNQNYEQLIKNGDPKLGRSWGKRSSLVKVTEVECTTLDQVIESRNFDFNFHFVKIDAQGAEYEILKGAESFLDVCIGIHLELFTVPLYKGIKLLPEVKLFLEERGFELIKKFETHGSFASQNDCLFIKKEVEGNENILVKDQILKIYKIAGSL